MFTFCTFLREKLIGHAFCTFSMLIGHVYILHFLREKVDGTILHFERKVNWTNLNFALCLGEKLMGNVYILREKMIGHVYSLQLFSPFNFSFH